MPPNLTTSTKWINVFAPNPKMLFLSRKKLWLNIAESIIKKLAKQENVTEELKANHQLEWVARMNNIKNRAEEIVYNEYVYN